MRFRPRPPLFLGFRELFWGLLFAWIVLVGGFNGFYFGALYGWRSGLVSFAVQAVVGFPMAAWGADWSRWEARKHDLPDWEDYDPPRATPVVRATPPRKATGALILAAATFGFLVAAFLIGHIVDTYPKAREIGPMIGIMLIGVGLIYLFGALQLGIVLSLTLEQATAAWQGLQDRFDVGELAWVPTTEAQLASAESWTDVPFEIKGLEPVEYEAYNPGEAYGTLRLFTLEELEAAADILDRTRRGE